MINERPSRGMDIEVYSRQFLPTLDLARRETFVAICRRLKPNVARPSGVAERNADETFRASSPTPRPASTNARSLALRYAVDALIRTNGPLYEYA